MSLINEALKRAEAEKAGRKGNLSAVSSISPLPTPKQASKSSPLVAAVVAAGVVAALAGAVGTFHGLSALGLEKAQATVAHQADNNSPCKTADRPATPAGPKALDKPQAEPAPSSQAPSPANHADKPSPQEASQARGTQQKSGQTEVKSTTKNARPLPVDKSAPSPTSSGKSGYTLSGIMHGPAGNMALINGRLVRKGQSIGNARLVEITEYTVLLEVDGKQFTLRM